MLKNNQTHSTYMWRHKDFKPHIHSHDGFVAFDSLQSDK